MELPATIVGECSVMTILHQFVKYVTNLYAKIAKLPVPYAKKNSVKPTPTYVVNVENRFALIVPQPLDG
jgi:hypothetical protein